MLSDYIKEPKRDWSDKQWIEYCSVQLHNPWINESEREYYKEKFTDLINKNSHDKTNKEDH